MILTYRFRLKDKHAAELNRQARAVSHVWNFCNETQQKAVQSGRKWLSAFDLQRLTAGSGPMLGLRAQTVCAVCHQYTRSRIQHRKAWLRFRGRRSLGWIPLHEETLRLAPTGFRFMGIVFEPMHTREIPSSAKIKAGAFAQDAKGHWYLNVSIEAEWGYVAPQLGHVGIDLGLKDLATLSDGRSVAVPKFYRRHETALATSQRARKTKRARAIHAKIANRRKDFLHKLSKGLADEFGLIFVGDVSSSKLARTSMAKSVHDAGWSALKSMLSYKTHLRGGSMLEVPEAYTTQVCSECGAMPASRPKGIADLGIRRWTCDCGAEHDRDVNAAKNIARLGLETLVAGAAQMRSGQSLNSKNVLLHGSAK